MVSERDKRTDTSDERETADILQREVRGEEQYVPAKDASAKGPVESVTDQVKQILPDDYPSEGTGVADI